MTEKGCFHGLSHLDQAQRDRLDQAFGGQGQQHVKDSAPGLWLMSSSPWKCQLWAELSAWVLRTGQSHVESLADQFSSNDINPATGPHTATSFHCTRTTVLAIRDVSGMVLREGGLACQVALEKPKKMLRKEATGRGRTSVAGKHLQGLESATSLPKQPGEKGFG